MSKSSTYLRIRIYGNTTARIVLGIVAVVIGLILFYAVPKYTRSGCCSHHGGVCGCACCDGTNLSATCLAKYPQCNNHQ